MIEFCRACRDEREELVEADFILWGKLIKPEFLGPRCHGHARVALGAALNHPEQCAVFDLRPYQKKDPYDKVVQARILQRLEENPDFLGGGLA